MLNPRFSIVIPTRERAETLWHTLRACLAQRFDSYEIVVCDNCSSAATKETVKSFESRKIKYIIDRKQLVINCVQALRADRKEEWRRSLLAIRNSLADDIDLQKWFDFKFLNCSPFLQSHGQRPEWKKGFDGRNLYLDAMEFGVTDVLGVAELCEKLMGYREKVFEWPKREKWLRRRLRSVARILIKGQ